MTRTAIAFAIVFLLSTDIASAQWVGYQPVTNGPRYALLSNTYREAFVGVGISPIDISSELPVGRFDIRFPDGSWKARVTFDDRERATSTSSLVSTDNPSIRFYRPTGAATAQGMPTYVWWIENSQGSQSGVLGGLAFRTRSIPDGTGQTIPGTESTADMVTRMMIRGDGNVGIGTTNPSHLLSVNGAVKAREITVTDLNWADFVFYPGYDLMPLSELAQFIKEQGHLPAIPTAAEVEKEGVELGSMQALLLQKIEELTLYVIEQNAEIERLQMAVHDLQGRAE